MGEVGRDAHSGGDLSRAAVPPGGGASVRARVPAPARRWTGFGWPPGRSAASVIDAPLEEKNHLVTPRKQ